LNRVYYYSEVKWEDKPRSGKPFCPKCGANPEKIKELERYPGYKKYPEYPPTELFVDYQCETCGENFTVNWS
jgi:predicted RNA-binding Zn-ribbon protein involved in translation (DUF1610 family)